MGETVRSSYERQKEHFRDCYNLNLRSQILKHYLEVHQNIKLEKLDMRVRVIGRYRSSFKPQIGESVWLNDGITILNSKNEYNRRKIQRLGLDLKSEDALEEYKEKQIEAKLRQELSRL